MDETKMEKRINYRLIATTLLSIADEAIIITIVVIILLQIGVHVPLWAVVTLALIFLAFNFIGYRALRKNPQLGFENMIGKNGFTEEPIFRKGTVRIGRELWSAATRGEKIEKGIEIIVIEQSGLRLTVKKREAEG